jgi:hypothetical protein
MESKLPTTKADMRAAGEWGRSIFGAAWRRYVAATSFASLPKHDQAVIRIAFVAGWRAHQEALQ